MKRLFVDTGVWLCAILPRERGHRAAVALLEEIATGRWHQVFTSDYVIAEGLNWIRKKTGRVAVAQAFLAHVFGIPAAPPLVTGVLRVHRARFFAALDRYRGRPDADLSFTDWTTVVLMEAEGIETMATFDTGFAGIVPHVVP